MKSSENVEKKRKKKKELSARHTGRNVFNEVVNTFHFFFLNVNPFAFFKRFFSLIF